MTLVLIGLPCLVLVIGALGVAAVLQGAAQDREPGE